MRIKPNSIKEKKTLQKWYNLNNSKVVSKGSCTDKSVNHSSIAI